MSPAYEFIRGNDIKPNTSASRAGRMKQIEPQQYKIGDALASSGDKICFIVGQTDRCGVFLIEGNWIRWEFYADHALPATVRRAQSKYEALWYEVSRST